MTTEREEFDAWYTQRYGLARRANSTWAHAEKMDALEAWQAARRSTALPLKWISLLEEARDNCMASIAEKDITPSRREYRKDLLSRLNDLLAEQKQAPTQGD